ncbi:MAG: LamG-like jellyroll fold domain-containing protein, partial [Planctomycetota bacterium]
MTLTNDFTWAFWAKQVAANTANNDIIFGNRMDENAVDFVPRQFIKFTPTKFEWHMNGNGDDNLEYEDIPADVWLHHAVVKTGDQLTYYRNGIEASSGTFTQPLDVPQPLFFGGDNEGSAGENWNGYMSDACIYDRALSAGEVMFLADLRAVPADPGTNGLVASYALDGDTNDGSGNELHGTIVGEPAFVEGQVGMALQLDGVDDHVNLGNPAVLDRATVYAKGGDNSGGIRYTLAMGESNDNRMTLTTDDDSAKRQARGGTVVNDGEWHHVVGMRSGDTTIVFVDGDKDGAIDVPEGYDLSGSAQANALLGAITDARDATGATLEKFFTGILDEVAVYDRALSGGEIRYLAGFSDEPENLLANGSFEDDEPILDDPDWVQWCTWNPAEGAGSNVTIVDTDAIDGARSLKVEPIGPENWHFILVNISFAADLSKNYTATFWAKAEAPRPLTVQMKASDNSVNAWNATSFDLTTDWAEYSYTSEVQHTDVKLEFLCAAS